MKSLINYHSLESGSNTPDWVLAEYLTDCLENFNNIMQIRERYYGRDILQKEEKAK